MSLDAINIQFNVFQIDEWTPSDRIFLEIGGTEIDLGEMDFSSFSETIDGYIEGITWHRNTETQCIDMHLGSDQLDKKHVVDLTIPSSHLKDNHLTFEIHVETSNGIEIESVVVDSLKVLANYGCETSSPVTVLAQPSHAPTLLAPNEAPSSMHHTTTYPTTLNRCETTVKPTRTDIYDPSNNPTKSQTTSSTAEPTSKPTSGPTGGPASIPTGYPTFSPTEDPTARPTTLHPTEANSHPSAEPTSASPTTGPRSEERRVGKD